MHLKVLQWLTQTLLLSAVSGNIHIGGALNVFSYFGDLGRLVNVNVNPHLYHNWFYDGSSVDVFQEVYETRSPLLYKEDPVFNGDFDLELCPSLSALYKAFFKSYKIEGLEKPWKAFTGGWTSGAAARYLGINSSFLTKEHCYVLVRLSRHHEQIVLSSHKGLQLNNWTSERLSHLVPGQVGSVLDFIRISGSHFVTSYTTGNSLYQVFVFTPSVFAEIQRAMSHPADQQRFFNFFTPFYAEHIGKVLPLSGNSSIEDWVASHLYSRILMFHYPNLIKLRSAPDLLQTLNYLLGNDALLSVELKSIASLIRDDKRRLWFREVLDNHLKLWELNV